MTILPTGQGIEWGRILSGLGQGLMQAGQPGGNFGTGLMQGAQFYDSRQDRHRQAEMDELLKQAREQQIADARRANQEEEERRRIIADIARQAGQQGPMAPNNGRPGGPAPSGPMQSGYSMGQVFQAFPELGQQYLAQQIMPQEAKPTDDLREYEFARSQGYQGSFFDYQNDLRKAGAANSTFNVNMPKSLLAGDEAMLKLGGEAFMQAQEVLPLFGIAREAAKGFEQSGPLGGPALFTERAKNYLGLPNNASAGEVLQGMQTRLGTLMRVPGSGATSNYEMQLYMQSVPGLMNSQQGNIALANIGEKLIKRRMADFQRLQEHVARTGSTLGYQPDETPALTEEETAMLQGSGSATPQAAPQPAPQQAPGAPDYSTMSDEELLRAIGVSP